MRYTYPQAQGAYRWNMVQRIKQVTGLDPVMTGDFQFDNGFKTLVEFSRALTAPEKAALDTLMASRPADPPAPAGTVFKLDDLWEKLDKFNTASGIQFRLYYSESVPGSGVIDTIELHASQALTNTQKSKVKTTFANMIIEV